MELTKRSHAACYTSAAYTPNIDHWSTLTAHGGAWSCSGGPATDGSVECLCRRAECLCGRVKCLCGRAECLCGSVECLCGSVECLCGRVKCLCGRAECLCGKGVEGLSVCVEGSGRVECVWKRVEGLSVRVEGSGRVECLCGRE